MVLLDLAIFGLLGTAIVFAIIELGLSAYFEHAFRGTVEDYYGDIYSLSPPAAIHLLLFCSIWTLVIVGVLAVLQIFVWRGRRHDAGGVPAILTLVINALTMIFWLAGFADLSADAGGYPLNGTLGALEAFAVMSWLVFLALLVLNILTAVSVVRSETHGYGPMSRRTPVTPNIGTAPNTAAVPKA